MNEKQQILSDSAQMRRRDVEHYQINIDNYRAAIAEIDAQYGDNPDMLQFREHLGNLLKSSIVEQTKEKIMLSVIERQLAEMEVPSAV
jgi:hypothetical protein